MSSRRGFTKHLFQSPSVLSGEQAELKKSDFQFERRLGDGAFGQVWRVRHKQTNKSYAMKQVPKDKVLKMLGQFRRQVFIMYQLNHPHIIKLYNHFQDERYFYLIMQQAQGGNLFHKLYRQKHLLERVAAQYFREIILAVQYLHSHVPAIIHRDIKPENILLDKQGRMKLTDFGWSNYYQIDAGMPRFTMCGTPEYLPPQMVDQRGHDTSADIWCLGILLYEMLTGSTPFKSGSRQRMLRNILEARVKYPMSFPPLAKQLINKMLEKSPEKRISIEQVKEDRWLMEHVPMRDTITQSLNPKPLPDFGGVVQITSGYMVINKPKEEVKESPKAVQPTAHSDNEETEEIKCQQSAFRSSIKLLKEQLDLKLDKNVQEKVQLQGNSQELNQQLEELKTQEAKFEDKKKEYADLYSVQKELLAKIDDIEHQYQRLNINYQVNCIQKKIQEQKKSLMEKQRTHKLLKKQLENLYTGMRHSNQDFMQKEKLLSSLKIKSQKLKDQMLANKHENQARISELAINSDILRNRIQSQSRPENSLGVEQREIVNDLMNHVMEQTRTCSQSYNNKTKHKIEEFEELLFETEMEIANVKIGYQEQKATLISETRKKKDAVVHANKLETEEAIRNRRKKRQEAISKLKEELIQAREQEHIHLVDQNEIEVLKKQITEMKERLENFGYKTQQLKLERERLKILSEQKAKEIEEAETEMGNLRIQFLAGEFLISGQFTSVILKSK